MAVYRDDSCLGLTQILPGPPALCFRLHQGDQPWVVNVEGAKDKVQLDELVSRKGRRYINKVLKKRIFLMMVNLIWVLVGLSVVLAIGIVLLVIDNRRMRSYNDFLQRKLRYLEPRK